MKHNTQKGFTLIELLAAMAILMAMVAMIGIIFTKSNIVWTIGSNNAENNTSGRTAINMIARDLQYAVADSNLTFCFRDDESDESSYGFTNSEIFCVSFQNDSSDANRTACEIYYWVREMTNSQGGLDRYELVRGCHSITNYYTNNCYWNTNWYETGPSQNDQGVIAQNVAAFCLLAPDSNGKVFQDYNSQDTNNNNRLPEYADVYLEILNKREAKQAAAMPSSNQKEFVERNAKRFTARIFFHNRYGFGYKDR